MKLGNLLESAKTAATGASQAALDTTIQAIEKWLEEFPKIEGYGLQISNFSFIMRISPSLEIEMKGNHEDFPISRLDEIIAQNKKTSLVGMVFTAIRTAYRLHSKIASKPDDLLLVKLRLSISPEISVFIGKVRVS
jgi:hypothetical protein